MKRPIVAATLLGVALAAIISIVAAEHQHPEGWTLPFNTNDTNWNNQSYEIHLYGVPGLADPTGLVYQWAVDYSPEPEGSQKKEQGFPGK